MARMRRVVLTATVALAGAFAAGAPAPAATDGTSNTIMTARFDSAPLSSPLLTADLSAVAVSALPSGPMHSYALSFTAIEFKNNGCVAFMDYTDDACMAFAPGGQEGEE